MAKTSTQHVWLDDDNTFDLGFRVNGEYIATPVSRITVALYDKAQPGDPPIMVDSDDDDDAEAFSFTDASRIVFAFGNLAQLQDQGGNQFHAEVRLYGADGKRVRVTSPSTTGDLPSLSIIVHEVL